MVTGTDAPSLSTAVAPQVGAIAVLLGATLEAVQVMLVFTVLPGALTIGVAGWVTPHVGCASSHVQDCCGHTPSCSVQAHRR
ncbi:MAG: hypothetical protein IPN04_11650 [Rhodoferax sp.]|nr:hypothetical protein [Rhodoferax sp.]